MWLSSHAQNKWKRWKFCNSESIQLLQAFRRVSESYEFCIGLYELKVLTSIRGTASPLCILHKSWTLAYIHTPQLHRSSRRIYASRTRCSQFFNAHRYIHIMYVEHIHKMNTNARDAMPTQRTFDGVFWNVHNSHGGNVEHLATQKQCVDDDVNWYIRI